jgi:hypothetical protein
MNIAFCIGNGLSRKNVNLESLKDIGPCYGCNKLILEFDLDNTIIVDKTLLIDIISQGYNKKTNIYTRKRWQKLVEAENLKFLSEPIKDINHRWDNEIHWGSGTHALNLAASNNSDLVIMIGYDLTPGNMYNINANVDPSCWIYQVNQCFLKFPNTQFVQIQNENWTAPDEWQTDNFSIDTLDSLTQMLKDLS